MYLLRHHNILLRRFLAGSIVCRFAGPARQRAQRLKTGVDRLRHLHLFLLVRLGEGVEYHKKSEQERNEIGVRNKPPVVAHSGARYAGIHAACSFGSRLKSSTKPASLISRTRGFIPSRIEITPSSIISRRRWPLRMRMRIFPANGRKNRFA